MKRTTSTRALASFLAFAAAACTSVAVQGQEAPLDPDTGLPVSKPFEFPELGVVQPF